MQSPVQRQLMDEVTALITAARPLVEGIARQDRDLGSQIRRALNGVALNVAEGFGTAAGNARVRFQSARGSLYEACAGLKIAVAWNHVTDDSCTPLLATMDRLSARLYGLSRR